MKKITIYNINDYNKFILKILIIIIYKNKIIYS